MASILCVWEWGGKWTHISPQKPFDYPFSFQCHVSPRGPNLMIDNPLRNLTTWLLTAGFLPAPLSIFSAFLHLSLSLSFFLSLFIWTLINFQTNLFIVHCHLSAKMTSMIDPFPLHMTDFTLTLKMVRNYSSAVFLHFTFPQRRRAQS